MNDLLESNRSWRILRHHPNILEGLRKTTAYVVRLLALGAELYPTSTRRSAAIIAEVDVSLMYRHFLFEHLNLLNDQVLQHSRRRCRPEHCTN